MIRTEIDSMPADLDEVTRRLMQLEIEEAALKKEKDRASKERLEAGFASEIADLRGRRWTSMKAQWEAEKAAIDAGARPSRGDRASSDRDIETRGASEYDLETASRSLKHGRLPEVAGEAPRRGGTARRGRSRARPASLREEVTEERDRGHRFEAGPAFR